VGSRGCLPNDGGKEEVTDESHVSGLGARPPAVQGSTQGVHPLQYPAGLGIGQFTSHAKACRSPPTGETGCTTPWLPMRGEAGSRAPTCDGIGDQA
jgi:hypothetical protein